MITCNRWVATEGIIYGCTRFPYFIFLITFYMPDVLFSIRVSSIFGKDASQVVHTEKLVVTYHSVLHNFY